MESKASITNVRISPRKLMPVAALVRGRGLEEALGILAFTPKKGAPVLKKLIESARANAAEKQIDVDTLKVKTVEVNKGPTMFRMLPRQRGMANRIMKRTSHLSVVLADGA